MSDVVLGAVIGVVAALLGAATTGAINHLLQTSTEKRAAARRQSDSVVEAQLRALDQAHRMMVVNAEYARAASLGEEAAQIARLREQTESANFLEADATLVSDPETVAAFLSRTRWWLDRPRGAPVTEADVQLDGELASRLQAACRRARERILSETS